MVSVLHYLLQNQKILRYSNSKLKSQYAQILNIIHKRKYHDVQGDVICPNQIMGMSFIRDPRLNKGLAYSLVERQVLGIHGLLPPKFISQEEQLELCRLAIGRYKENLNKYLYLNELHDDNEKLFYRLLTEDVNELMPIVYTPTVGLACLKFGLIYRRPRGIFITCKDKGYFYEILRNWPESNVRCICVTDGERILGLGDLGACGMGIPVGKLALYTALAGIPPHQCLPITLDVGTNNEDFLCDPLYIGLKQKRMKGTEYDEVLDEFMYAVVKRFGQNTLIQFEDFGFANASRLLQKYRNKFCTFNDDIQGTASVVIAGFITAAGLTEKKKLAEHRFLFFGAGSAGLGCAKLLVVAMEREGIKAEESRQKIVLMDAHGLITKTRTQKPIADQSLFAVEMPDTKSLLEVVKAFKPSVLVGVSATGKTFTPEVLQEMAKLNKRPIIFALSNPTIKAECTAEEAYKNTEGRVIYASGSPMPPVQFSGHTYHTSQGNNAYIFPGIALAVIATGIYHIQDELFLIAAEQLAQMVTEQDLATGKIYPPLSKIKEASVLIASKIFEHAYKKGIATIYPEPKDIRHHIISQMYNYCYESALPVAWKWNKSSYDFQQCVKQQQNIVKTQSKSIDFKPT